MTANIVCQGNFSNPGAKWINLPYFLIYSKQKFSYTYPCILRSATLKKPHVCLKESNSLNENSLLYLLKSKEFLLLVRNKASFLFQLKFLLMFYIWYGNYFNQSQENFCSSLCVFQEKSNWILGRTLLGNSLEIFTISSYNIL